jgi:hypothetical protein
MAPQSRQSGHRNDRSCGSDNPAQMPYEPRNSGNVFALGIPEDEDVEGEAERGELVFLALAVGLAQFAAVAVEDHAGDGVAAFVAV